MAKTTSTPPLNHTFSGPEGKEVLTFSVAATSSTVYYFVVFAPAQEKPILYPSVRTWTVTESLIVRALAPVLGVISLVSMIKTHKDQES